MLMSRLRERPASADPAVEEGVPDSAAVDQYGAPGFLVRILELVMQEIVDQAKKTPLNNAEHACVGKTAASLQALASIKGPEPFGPSLMQEATVKSQNDEAFGDLSVSIAEPTQEVRDELEWVFSPHEHQSDSLVKDSRVSSVPKAESTVVHETRNEPNTLLADDRLLRLFLDLDADGGGTISAAELRNSLQKKLRVPSARIQRLIDAADADASGEIDFEEWRRVIFEDDGRAAREWMAIAEELAKADDRQEQVDERCMMRPDSLVRLTWDMLLAFTCIYVVAMFPFTLGFESHMSESMLANFSSIELVVDVMFLVDVLMNFRTGYVDTSTGTVIMDWRRVGYAYFVSYFTLDVASSLPLDYILGEGMAWNRFLKAFKLVKILKGLRGIGGTLAKTSFFELGDVVHMFLNYPLVRHGLRRSNLLLLLVLLCHWMACFLACISLEWFEENGSVNSSLKSVYLAALYYAYTTTTTVGYGDVKATNDLERVLACFAMVIGATFYGYAVGTIASIVSSRELAADMYHERMDLVFAWLQHHRLKLPKELRQRLVCYFRSVLSQKAAVDEANMMNDLSPTLEKEVGERLIPYEIRLNPLFDGLPFNATIRLLKIANKLPADRFMTVVEPGEAGTAMFIVHRGSMLLDATTKEATDSLLTSTICKPDESPSTPSRRAALRGITLQIGDSFGEEILLGIEDIYKYKVLALENSELYSIEEGAFEQIFQHMPRMRELILSNTQEVLRLKGYLEVEVVAQRESQRLTRCNAMEDLDCETPLSGNVFSHPRSSRRSQQRVSCRPRVGHVYL